MAHFKSKEIEVTTEYDIGDCVEFTLIDSKEKKEGGITAITISELEEEMYHVRDNETDEFYSSLCDIEILRKVEE